MLVTLLCPTLWDPRDYSLPGFSVHGSLQARILEWVAIPFSRGSWGGGGGKKKKFDVVILTCLYTQTYTRMRLHTQ